MQVESKYSITQTIGGKEVTIKRGLNYLRAHDLGRVGQEWLLMAPNVNLDGVSEGVIKGSIVVVTEGVEKTRKNTGDLAIRMKVIAPDETVSDRMYLPEKIHELAKMAMWRYKFECPLGSMVEYEFNDKLVTVQAPSRGGIKSAVFSCNGRQTVAEQEELDRHGGIEQFWADVHQSHKEDPMNLVIGLGDQLYNDDIFENLPDFVAFQQLDLAGKIQAEFTDDMRKDLEEYLFRKYCKHFSIPEFQAMLAKTFKMFSWDDHDIRDGNGSYDASLQNCPVFRGVFEVAFQMYCLFQHHMTEAEQEDREGLFGSNGINRMVHFGEVSMLNLDTRSERTREQIISEETFEALKKELKGIPEGTEHLLVLLGVPLVYPNLTIGDEILEEYNQISRTIFKKKTMPTELRDDLNDHWNNPLHDAERDLLIKLLHKIAKKKGVRVTLLSGDVHIGALGELKSPGKVPLEADPGYMVNLITSPIGNRPGEMLKYPLKALSLIQNRTGSDIGGLKGHMVTYELEGRVPGRAPDFIPWNNWLRVDMNRENHGLDCDLHAMKPEEKDPSQGVFAKMGRAFKSMSQGVMEWWRGERMAMQAAEVHKVYSKFVPALKLA